MMMTKATIALAAALFFAVCIVAQASDFPGSHERQGEGFSSGSWWASPSRTYDSVPKHEYIRHHRPSPAPGSKPTVR
jgi:hypothetical protein